MTEETTPECYSTETPRVAFRSSNSRVSGASQFGITESLLSKDEPCVNVDGPRAVLIHTRLAVTRMYDSAA
jgi:hypothetical protein